MRVTNLTINLIDKILINNNKIIMRKLSLWNTLYNNTN